MEERHEISFGEFEPSKDQARVVRKVKDSIAQAIARLRQELRYKPEWLNASQSPRPDGFVPNVQQEKADWLVRNGKALSEHLKGLCLDLRLSENYANDLWMFFVTGSDFYLQSADTAPFDFAVRADFINYPFPFVHEVYRWLPSGERDRPELLANDLDFLVRGNLETFTVQGWRQLGSYIAKVKTATKAGRLYKSLRGRPSDDALALECARLKDEERKTLVEIGKRFGFSITADEYGNFTQCSTARYFVKQGRKLRKTTR